ncbi:S1 family peptidase [Reinekea blandensis]|uniref:NTP pyrophosphohydrolase n=1 Tax=Reinekea blandensis MED297 TaxID=314283 RepID=A4BJC8_9GAMM|nr:serine protease [Reinekea blandensis]EAR07786.1 NTP pyrophosphohydrolase [Reinekea sp. MED297] [Reinekea blandensis MED297]
MIRHAVLATLLSASALVHAQIDPRIIDGERVNPGNYDFFTTLLVAYDWQTGRTGYEPPSGNQFSWNAFCGGAYIGDGLIVTAAHCVDSLPSTGNLYVLVGNYTDNGMQYEFCADQNVSVYRCEGSASKETTVSNNFHFTGWTIYTGSDDPIPVPVENIKVHPFYSANAFDNDIAVLTLPDTFNGIAITWPANSISLPSSDQFSTLAATGTPNNVRVMGHGNVLSHESDFEASADLLQVDLKAASDATCASFFGSNYDSSTMICAGDPGQDSCQGDSGGPLIDPATNTLLGVVSFGPVPCGDQVQSYGVYSDVYAFRNWIRSGGVQVDGMAEIAEDGTVHRMGNNDSPITIGAFGLVSWLAGVLLLFGRRR